MIEVIKQQFSKEMSNEEKTNRVREYLQAIALKIMDEKGFFGFVAFTGGTALRMLFGLRRFSEDLDFSLIKKNGPSFSEINSALCKGFALLGLKVESKPHLTKSIFRTMLKFPGLLNALGISPLEKQNLSIRLEADINPPKGALIQRTLIQKFFIFHLTHLDLPSMFATKLHACFYRRYTKGRDFYDFVWYMTNKVKPNFLLLNNAIKQTEGVNPKINEKNFKGFLLERIKRINFDFVRKDVERFLEDKSELRLLDINLIKGTIESVYSVTS